MSTIFHVMPDAPKPVAPYSHAVEADGFVFVTGQLATDADDDARPMPAGIEAQTRKVMDNLGRVLRGVGLDFANDDPQKTAFAHPDRRSAVWARCCPATGAWPERGGIASSTATIGSARDVHHGVQA